eukprot:1151686-Pelagomonas_calceolata.AAC.14
MINRSDGCAYINALGLAGKHCHNKGGALPKSTICRPFQKLCCSGGARTLQHTKRSVLPTELGFAGKLDGGGAMCGSDTVLHPIWQEGGGIGKACRWGTPIRKGTGAEGRNPAPPIGTKLGGFEGAFHFSFSSAVTESHTRIAAGKMMINNF